MKDVLLDRGPVRLVGARGVVVGAGCGDAQQLLGVVPLVEGARLVDALVALQAHELAVRRCRHGGGQRGLADTGRPLDEQRFAELVGEVDGRRDLVGGEVAVLGQARRDVVDRGEAGGVRHARSLPDRVRR